jgi:apolipoprotein N-acyltransferase
MKRSTAKSPRRAQQVPASNIDAADASQRALDDMPAKSVQCFALALSSSLLMFAALPPLDLWPLAWIAPVPWLVLCRQQILAGRRPYRAIWLAGFLFWMAALHWIRLPHPANYLGWVALASYLAFYIPAFVWLTRIAVHRWRWSIILAAPVVWTALELVRGHLLTGFTMASLGHTQYRWIKLIQVADFAGAYGVSFVVMCGAACLARAMPLEGRRIVAWPALVLASLFAAVLGYGSWRMAQPLAGPGPRISLIQGSIDTEIKSDPRKNEVVFREYFDLSLQAVREAKEIDLLIWPETMFRDSLLEFDPATVSPPPGAKWDVEMLGETSAYTRGAISDTAQALGVPLLLGIDTHRYGAGTVESFNSALAVSATGELGERYDKLHPVMFGEYIPFANRFPIIYRLLPIKSSLSAGTRDVTFRAGNARLSANICFESVLPHLIRGQVVRLRARGEEPDVLINLTNDGWFWGSSELDMHLVCGVFRAVECRKPLLIAANTGFSADIDSAGRIRQQAPRRATGVIIADVELDGRRSPYTIVGDAFSGICLAIVCLLAFSSLWTRFRSRRAARITGVAH